MISVGGDVVNGELSYTAGGSVNQSNHCGEQFGDSSKIYKQNCHMIQQFHFLASTQRTEEFLIRKVLAHRCLLRHYSQLLRHGTNPNAHEQIEKLWHIYSMEYYSAIKNNKTLTFDRKWKNMEDSLLSEASQAMKERHCMSPLNIYRMSTLYN